MAGQDAPLGSPRPNGPGDWVANTQSHLRKVDEMRKAVRRQFKRDILSEDEAQAPKIGGPLMEDRLKRRHNTNQCLSKEVKLKMDTVQHMIFQVKQTIQDLSRCMTLTRGALSVVEMRLDLRGRRPASEQVEDAFNEALNQEHTVLREIIAEIARKLEASSQLVQPLEEAKAELVNSRLTLHLDRTGYTQQLLDSTSHLEKDSALFCRYASSLLAEAEKKSKKALTRTNATMKSRIAATRQLKEQIEKDMLETRKTITDAELHLDRLERQLQVQLAMPERQAAKLDGSDLCNKNLAASTGVLAELRAKIKAAAYTGGQGRQLGVLFGRFDRDGSGMLDEDEVRRAFRRACRIPPAVVSDAEISSLCGMLDEDQSGTVSISEITDFLCADVNVDSLEEQCSWARTALGNLVAAQAHSQADLRSKVAAWKIDVACSRVNPIKGLKLDGLPSPGRAATASHSARTPALPSTRPTTQGQTQHMGKSQSDGRPNTAAKDMGGAASAREMQSDTSPKGWGWSKTSPRKPKAQPKQLPALSQRPEAPTLGFDANAIDTVRSKIKAASTAGTSQPLDVIFAKFDKESTGRLSEDEFKQALRRSLRMGPSSVADSDISAVFAALDADCSGYISIDELIAFVNEDVSPKGPKPGPTSKMILHDNLSSQAGPADESAGAGPTVYA